MSNPIVPATSTRGLAPYLGASKSTIHRDNTKPPGLERVTGRDGKSYPARSGQYLSPAAWLIERREQGASYRDLAREAGVSHQTIMRMFRRLQLAIDNGAVQVSHSGQVDQPATDHQAE